MNPASPCQSCGKPIPGEAVFCPACGKPRAVPQEQTVDLTSLFPKVPGYRVLSLLGEGGMGKVFLAEDESLGRKVAVKVTSEKILSDPQAGERFLREARAMASIQHPHVVAIHAFGYLDRQPYFVMEFIEGQSLSSLIRKEGKLAPAEALRIMKQAAQALEAAWEKGIIHRDIKPSNIMLTPKGAVKVVDFGLAKPAASEGDAALTGTGFILGSPMYMAPEQGRGETVDFRTDMYSLGIVLYEMLAGGPPFEGNTPLSVIAKHLTEPLPSLRQKCPGLPEALTALVERLAAKDPAQRYASYAELLKTLDKLLGASTQAVAAAMPPQATASLPKYSLPSIAAPTVPPPVSVPASRKWPYALAFAVVALAFLTLLLGVRRHRQNSAELRAEMESAALPSAAAEAPPEPAKSAAAPASEEKTLSPNPAKSAAQETEIKPEIPKAGVSKPAPPPAETSAPPRSSHEPVALVPRTLSYDFVLMNWAQDWNGISSDMLQRSKAKGRLVMLPGTRLNLKRMFKGDVEVMVQGNLFGYMDDGRFAVALHAGPEMERGYVFAVAQKPGVGRALHARLLRMDGGVPSVLDSFAFPPRQPMQGFQIFASSKAGALNFRSAQRDWASASDGAYRQGLIGLECEGWSVELTRMTVEYYE